MWCERVKIMLVWCIIIDTYLLLLQFFSSSLERNDNVNYFYENFYFVWWSVCVRVRENQCVLFYLFFLSFYSTFNDSFVRLFDYAKNIFFFGWEKKKTDAKFMEVLSWKVTFLSLVMDERGIDKNFYKNIFIWIYEISWLHFFHSQIITHDCHQWSSSTDENDNIYSAMRPCFFPHFSHISDLKRREGSIK